MVFSRESTRKIDADPMKDSELRGGPAIELEKKALREKLNLNASDQEIEELIDKYTINMDNLEVLLNKSKQKKELSPLEAKQVFYTLIGPMAYANDNDLDDLYDEMVDKFRPCFEKFAPNSIGKEAIAVLYNKRLTLHAGHNPKAIGLDYDSDLALLLIDSRSHRKLNHLLRQGKFEEMTLPYRYLHLVGHNLTPLLVRDGFEKYFDKDLSDDPIVILVKNRRGLSHISRTLTSLHYLRRHPDEQQDNSRLRWLFIEIMGYDAESYYKTYYKTLDESDLENELKEIEAGKIDFLKNFESKFADKEGLWNDEFYRMIQKSNKMPLGVKEKLLSEFFSEKDVEQSQIELMDLNELKNVPKGSIPYDKFTKLDKYTIIQVLRQNLDNRFDVDLSDNPFAKFIKNRYDNTLDRKIDFMIVRDYFKRPLSEQKSVFRTKQLFAKITLSDICYNNKFNFLNDFNSVYFERRDIWDEEMRSLLPYSDISYEDENAIFDVTGYYGSGP